jgi:hypothetical protein
VDLQEVAAPQVNDSDVVVFQQVFQRERPLELVVHHLEHPDLRSAAREVALDPVSRAPGPGAQDPVQLGDPAKRAAVHVAQVVRLAFEDLARAFDVGMRGEALDE